MRQADHEVGGQAVMSLFERVGGGARVLVTGNKND